MRLKQPAVVGDTPGTWKPSRGIPLFHRVACRVRRRVTAEPAVTAD